MRILENASTLLNAVSSVKKVIKANAQNPMLSNMLLEFKGKKLNVTAANLSTELRTVHELTTSYKTSRFAVNASAFTGFLSTLDQAQDVILELNESILEIVQGDTICALPVFDADHFPSFEFEDKSTCDFKIDRSDFLHMIHTVSYAPSVNDVRVYMNGINLSFKGKSFYVVATNGHRLASIKSVNVAGQDIDAIIPNDGIPPLYDLLLNSDCDDVKVNYRGSTVEFVFGTVVFNVRTIDGVYPKWKQVVPSKKDTTELSILKSSLDHCLMRARSAHEARKAIANSKEVRLVVTAYQNRLTFSILPDGDSKVNFSDWVSCQYEGTEISMQVNIDYFINAISHATTDGKSVSIGLSPLKHSFLIRPTDSNESVHVISAMQDS